MDQDHKKEDAHAPQHLFQLAAILPTHKKEYFLACCLLLFSLVDCLVSVVHWDLDCRELRLSD